MKRRMLSILALTIFVVLSFWLRPAAEKTDLRGESSDKLIRRVETEGNVERTEYVDAEGNLTYARDKRWAAMVKTRDDQAGTVLEEYFDENGAPAPQYNGNCATLRTYDENRKNTQTVYLDDRGQQMNLGSGYARVNKAYDDKGRQISEFYFDTEDRPAAVSSGAYGFRREYPDEGRDYRMTYLGLDGQPMTIQSGYSALTRRLNADGRVIEERYYALDGAPCPASQGEYGFRKAYDAEGHETMITYLGRDGEPAMTSLGYAIVKNTYDDEGKLSRQMYFDEQGQPKAQPRGEYGTGYRDGKSFPLNASGSWKFDLNYILRTYPVTVLVFGLIATLLSALLSRRMNVLLLALYLVFIAYMTLMYRNEAANRLNLELFWSYRMVFRTHTMRGDLLDNIWLFIPLGAMLYRVFDNPRALLIPLMTSVSVELIQYVFGIGLCELDDVFNNTLGGCIGYLMGAMLRPKPQGNVDAMNGVPAEGRPPAAV